MRFIINKNIPTICNYPDGIDRLGKKYVNSKFYGKIKTLKDNDR